MACARAGVTQKKARHHTALNNRAHEGEKPRDLYHSAALTGIVAMGPVTRRARQVVASLPAIPIGLLKKQSTRGFSNCYARIEKRGCVAPHARFDGDSWLATVADKRLRVIDKRSKPLFM